MGNDCTKALEGMRRCAQKVAHQTRDGEGGIWAGIAPKRPPGPGRDRCSRGLEYGWKTPRGLVCFVIPDHTRPRSLG